MLEKTEQIRRGEFNLIMNQKIQILKIIKNEHQVFDDRKTSNMEQQINIIGISGSLKSTSANTNILRAMATMAPEHVFVKLFEGFDQLPHFNPEIASQIEVVSNFRQQIQEAHAVIISTPEYAFGVPGVLKMRWIGWFLPVS